MDEMTITICLACPWVFSSPLASHGRIQPAAAPEGIQEDTGSSPVTHGKFLGCFRSQGLYVKVVIVNTALEQCWKRILLISSKRYPGQGASSSAVAFIRVGIWRNTRRAAEKPRSTNGYKNPQHTALSSDQTHPVRSWNLVNNKN